VGAVASCGGLKIIFNSLLDGSPVQTSIIVQTLIALLDRPETRQYFSPGIDIEVALTGLYDPVLTDIGARWLLATLRMILAIRLELKIRRNVCGIVVAPWLACSIHGLASQGMSLFSIHFR
jgi:hypothetical protein